MRTPLVAAAALPLLALAPAACSKNGPAAPLDRPAASTPAPASSAACAHAVCADHFFVDAVPGACAAGGACTLALDLTATGDFHVNDEYPYRFKADEAPGVAFQGSGADKAVFSKPAGDWKKVGAKSGTMTVRLSPAGAGGVTISGTLKLSVCSSESCLIEQPRVAAVVTAK